MTSLPAKAYGALTRKTKDLVLWEHVYRRLREPKVKGSVELDDPAKRAVLTALGEAGVAVESYRVDVEAYQAFCERARYGERTHYYRRSYRSFLAEKSLEHFVAADLLELGPDDVYVDVGSADSPTPDIYQELFGARTYRQDAAFPAGIAERTIGGDAASMPVADRFASKMALHCAFEHFENDSDVRFIREAGRVLRPGGRLVILPLYLATTYSIQTDPSTLPLRGDAFEPDATLFCSRGFGNRHARFYDVPHFLSRVVGQLDGLDLTVLDIENATDADPSCYLKLAALIRKNLP